MFLPYSVTRQTETGKVFLKVVNPGAAAEAVKIELKGAAACRQGRQGHHLARRRPAETNTIAEPTKIVPVTEPLKDVAASFRYTFPAWSITVLELTAQ